MRCAVFQRRSPWRRWLEFFTKYSQIFSNNTAIHCLQCKSLIGFLEPFFSQRIVSERILLFNGMLQEREHQLLFSLAAIRLR